MREPKRVVLLANDTPGVRVARYLAQRGDEIARLYLHAPAMRKRGDDIVAASGCDSDRVFDADLLKDPAHVEGLNELAPDFLITIYWAHLLGQNVLQTARQGTVNFHPALLPVNRGWYPHVHSIIDGSPTGVTLHVMEETADTGPIWAQREVPLDPCDTAASIYVRLQDEIVDLFRQSWPDIAAGKITPRPQGKENASYHPKKEVDALDYLDPNETMTAREFVNRLRARSFGNRGFAYLQDDGQRVYLNLRLSPEPQF